MSQADAERPFGECRGDQYRAEVRDIDWYAEQTERWYDPQAQ